MFFGVTVYVYRESLARTSSLGGGSSYCHHHHPLCQSVTRLSSAGCYIHEPCPGDDGSAFTAPEGRRGSVGSTTSSMSDCSGQAASCTADDDVALPGTELAVTTAPCSNRVCVVQGLLRTNDDSGLAMEVRILHLYPPFYKLFLQWRI